MNRKILAYKPLPEGFSQAAAYQKISYWISTGFGLGSLPASGTWGTLLAWLIHVVFFPRLFTSDSMVAGLGVWVGVVVVGILTAEITERFTQVKDDSRINIDEVAGYFTVVLWLPAGLQYTIPAFFLSRFFDIIKPFPAQRLQDWHGGIGIMVDDLIAGLYACAVLHIILKIFA